jgi:quercetin dioxygenase-like cupin family protein
MKSVNLSDHWPFSDKGPHAEPLHVDQNGRAILFTLKPDQSIREHNVPSSPFYVIILSGHGVFSDGNAEERTFGPNTLLLFDPAEQHTVRAIDDLVFVGFLHGAPGAQR